MAREFTRINIAIWQDDDWRALPVPAQHLYLTLWTHPSLSYAGVVDWRPGRLAAMAGGWTAEDVITAAACLEHRLFIVVDPGTEECLIRSFVRFDGLMKQPRMAVSYANAFAEVASNDIRGVIVHEANKLHRLDPDLAGWAKPSVANLLGLAQVDPRARALPDDPFGDGFTPRFAPRLAQTQPDVSLPVSVPPTTATATATATDRRTTSEIADAIPDEPIRDDIDRLCLLLADRIEGNGVKRPNVTKAWRDSARLLIDKDGHTEAQAAWLIEWATADEFWRSNVLSMPTFRAKYDQLLLKARPKVAAVGNGQPVVHDQWRYR